MKDQVGQDIEVGSRVAYGVRNGNYGATKTGTVTAVHPANPAGVNWGERYDRVTIQNDGARAREVLYHANVVVVFGKA